MAAVNKWMIDPNDAVMLLVDHQSGLFQLVMDTSACPLERGRPREAGEIYLPFIGKTRPFGAIFTSDTAARGGRPAVNGRAKELSPLKGAASPLSPLQGA